MVHLVTASSPFHAQVITARLGAEGMLTQTRGAASTCPLPVLVDVFVERDQLGAASALLLADQAAAETVPHRARVRPVPPWVVGLVAVVIVVCSTVRWA